MIYTVLWLPETEQELAKIWLQSNDQNRVAAAANEIDKILQHQPEELGESRDGERRIVFSPPLGVMFVINKADKKVYIINVWKFQERSS